MTAPVCPACGQVARLTNGVTIYPHRPDLAEKPFWCCPVCPQTYTSCHPGTTRPLGTPAGAELRRARIAVHGRLDPLWRGDAGRASPVSRSTVYAWLAHALDLDGRDTHVGLFDLARCQAALAALTGQTPASVAAWAAQNPAAARKRGQARD